DRVVTRDDDHFRRVVDDEIDARRRLDGADVPSLAPDDAALHVVARQRDDRDRPLGDVFAGQTLDRDRDDLLRAPIPFLARFGLDVADVPGGVVTCFLGHLLDERPLRLVARHARRLLEALAHLVDQPVVFSAPVLQGTFTLPEAVFALGQLRLALREPFDL